MLNCIAEFTGSDSNKSRCGNGVQRTITSTCQRLTADLYAGIINNYYMKPSHKKPYYYIINRNEKDQPVTNPAMDDEIKEGSYHPNYIKTEDGKYRFYALKEPYKRIVNQSSVNLEIHSGNSN